VPSTPSTPDAIVVKFSGTAKSFANALANSVGTVGEEPKEGTEAL
jgi:hypothetical protein